ncbi:MAG: hypothetical protein R3B95_03010 [Nitrospirales bacterium]|nr:hypothetical protein [Nitrospirales bacterium]
MARTPLAAFFNRPLPGKTERKNTYGRAPHLRAPVRHVSRDHDVPVIDR